MEKVTVLWGQESIDLMENAKASSPEKQRYDFYKGKLCALIYAKRKETDTHVYWSLSQRQPRFENGRLFYSNLNKQGATYDKSTKKLKIWFDMNMYNFDERLKTDILKYFNIDWYDTLGNHKELMNKSILQKMINGKITNHRDYIKAYLKTSPYKNMAVSVELFYKTFKDGYRSAKSSRKFLEYSTDINHALEMLQGETKNHVIHDLYDQAAMLDRRVNPTWSEKRMNEVHAQWTRDIMEIEIKSLKQVEYNYPEISLPEGLSFITNNYELFQEGSAMKHCVYTNYESRIKNKKYFTFRYIKDGVRATVGVDRSYSDEATFSQMYGIGNSSIDPEHIEPIKEFIKTKYFQDWIKEQAGSNKIKEFEVEDAAWF
jgi:hypothetical protein